MQTTSYFEQKNASLKHQLHQKNKTIEDKDRQLKRMQDDIVRLKELLKLNQAKRFGASSEKLSSEQLANQPTEQVDFFNEAETLEDNAPDITEGPSQSTTIENHTRKKKPRVSIPADLPREEIIYDLSDEQKVCPHDGTRLECMGSQDHEQLDIIPAQIKVLRHKRLKYACPCCKEHVVIASKPRQPIEKSMASPGLLAFVATQKYCDALPLYRQSEIFKRIDVTIDRRNLANWMIHAGQLVQPLINLLKDHCLDRPLVHMDETTVQVLNEPDKKAQSKSYMWLLASFTEAPITLFHYSESRADTTPNEWLDHSVSALMVDGYSGYTSACNTYNIKRLGCWAHARRYFVEAKASQSKGKAGKVSKTDQALSWIQKLYNIERKIKAEPPDQRYRIRQIEAQPIIDAMNTWLDRSLQQVPPKTALGKALHYLNNQWDRLIAYLDDGRYPMDNNQAENAIRPFVIGRKNWLFSQSQRGARASANLYSIIETAKANQLNPYHYLKHVFKQLPNAQGLEDFEALLPWNIAPESIV